ncbi:MAG: hypothetical protein N3A55_11350, partial [Methylohalobius sp.]|nr:hypothetical protein [Methylohalobius sp.]
AVGWTSEAQSTKAARHPEAGQTVQIRWTSEAQSTIEDSRGMDQPQPGDQPGWISLRSSNLHQPRPGR